MNNARIEVSVTRPSEDGWINKIFYVGSRLLTSRLITRYFEQLMFEIKSEYGEDQQIFVFVILEYPHHISSLGKASKV